MSGYRFETRIPLRHTDSFGGTPFVHGGVLMALTEIALKGYDLELGIPSHRDVLRFQIRTEVHYTAPLRWDDDSIVRMRCSRIQPGKLTFECELAAAFSGQTVARMTHLYVYVDAQSGRPETPDNWLEIARAIASYETDLEIEDLDSDV